jgi:hypothetical protein
MATFKVSQGELWHRIYFIQADTLEEAKILFDKYLTTPSLAHDSTHGDTVVMRDPEYIEDIDDILWFDEHGEVQ